MSILMRYAATALLSCAVASAQDRPREMFSAMRPERPRTLVPPPATAAARAAAPVTELPPVSDGEKEFRKRSGKSPAGQNRQLTLQRPSGAWSQNSDGRWIWTALIRSAGAAGIRVHFTRFDVGRGMVWVHNGSGETEEVLGPYTGKGLFNDGDFWTELTAQERVWIEYAPENGEHGTDPPFGAPEIFHLWDSWASLGQENTSCFLDEVCYESNANVAQFSKAVAYLIFPDHSCSGTLLNDRGGSGVPYLLTAGHCIANDAEARAMLAVFSFKTNRCNGTVQAPRNYPQVSGATLLTRSLHQEGDSVIPDQPDFAFVRLSGNPQGASLFYLGWTTSPNASDRMTSVSHPRNLPQRLAAGNITSSADNNFYSVVMFQGATDHGSSGSAMANDSNQIAGVDSYGFSSEEVTACDTGDRRAGYTKFSAIYPSVTQWLEAATATPQATLSPLSLDFGTQQTNSPASTQTVTLKNSGKAALNISGVTILGTNPSDFSQINDCGSSLAAGTSCTVRVSFKPGSTGAKSATLTIANNASGSPHTVPLSGTGAAAPQAPSLLKQVISSVNGVANGTCKTPPAVGSFKTTDTSVWLYFEANPVSASDMFHLKYYKPDGTSYTTIDAKTSLSGYVCYSYYINIAGDAPASLPGNWTVKIFYNQISSPMATLNFTIVNASGPTQPPVSLSRYFNVTGIYNAGTTFSCSGGLDSVGYAYTSSVLKSPLTWSSNTFTLGPANALDAVSDTTIALSGQSDRLNFLAIGVNGNQENQQFVVRYADGSSDTYTQNISDWFTPQYYQYEGIAAAVPSRSVCNGGTERGPFYVYGYAFALNSGKTLSSITLPANSRVVVLAMTLSSSGDTPVISSVADGATFTSPISSGGWLMIKGANLATGSGAGRIWSGADFSGTRLPTSLDGVSVTVNGKSAYVYYASPTQINALVPTDPTTGNVNVQVTTAKGTSNVVSVSKQATSPGVFWYQNQYAIATAGSATIGPLRPARPGEIITLWCDGLGPTSPSYPDGTVVSNVYNTAFPVTVTIGGAPATVLFAGLTSTGLYQINLTVPRVPDGNAAVYVNVAGQRSADGITMAIRGQ